MSNPYPHLHPTKPSRSHPWRHQDYRLKDKRTSNLKRGEPLPETKPKAKPEKAPRTSKRVHRAKEIYFVEIYEISTGKVESRMGPMAEWKAEKVERGALMRINENFFVRTGTDKQLKAEAAAHERSTRRDEAALMMTCPECAAKIGKQCIRGHGKKRKGVHKSRLDAAVKAGLL